MSKPKVLVTRKWPTEVETELKEKYDVTLNENDVALTIPELKSAFQNYDCVCPTVTDPINEEVLSVENKKAKIIASFGVGFNHIDLDANNKINLKKVFSKAYNIGIGSIIIEGGKTLTKSVLRDKLINEFYLFKSKKNLGKLGRNNIFDLKKKITYFFRKKENIEIFLDGDKITRYY